MWSIPPLDSGATKLWVIATLKQWLRTACCQPQGMCTMSPGSCVNLIMRGMLPVLLLLQLLLLQQTPEDATHRA
jgi:hypothetical protein